MIKPLMYISAFVAVSSFALGYSQAFADHKFNTITNDYMGMVNQKAPQ